MSQPIGGDSHVRSNGFSRKRCRVVSQSRRQESFDRWTDSSDDRSHVSRLIEGRPLQFLERGRHRSTACMPEDDDETGAEAFGSKLDTADLRRRDDVPRNANDEEIAKALVEHDLYWDA